MNLTLVALFLTSFGIGTTEYGPIGFLPNIAHDLHITLSQAGFVVSAYALGVTIGSPILTLCTTRLSRHRVMMLLITLFIIGNFLSMIAPNFYCLIAARILTALCHGAYFGLGAVIAASVVTAKRKAQAIAMMIAGLTVANIFGVPLDTLVGQWFGWRAAFMVITVIGVLSAVALYAWIPREISTNKPNIFSELRVVMRPQVLLTLLISMLSSTSLFCVLTYITPMLEQVTQISPAAITAYLMLFGVGITLGNFMGGRLADWKLMPSLLSVFVLLTIVLGIFTVTVYSPITAALTILAWGITSFAAVPLLQMRVVHEAAEAPNLASTLNQAAFHLGNSSGALIGSLSVSLLIPYQQLMWLGAGIAVFALSITAFAYHKSLRPKLFTNVFDKITQPD